MYFSLLIEGAPFVGHDANDHNLLLKGRPFIMRLRQLSFRCVLSYARLGYMPMSPRRSFVVSPPNRSEASAFRAANPRLPETYARGQCEGPNGAISGWPESLILLGNFAGSTSQNILRYGQSRTTTNCAAAGCKRERQQGK